MPSATASHPTRSPSQLSVGMRDVLGVWPTLQRNCKLQMQGALCQRCQYGATDVIRTVWSALEGKCQWTTPQDLASFPNGSIYHEPIMNIVGTSSKSRSFKASSWLHCCILRGVFEDLPPMLDEKKVLQETIFSMTIRSGLRTQIVF